MNGEGVMIVVVTVMGVNGDGYLKVVVVGMILDDE